mgnify:FL=1|jgi:dihydrofolate synthase/folylpolyglutamate synthase
MIDVNEYLKGFYKGTKEPSLKAMHYFMDKYNNFEKEMKFIHIAGTNGKGSCVEIISNILKIQGYKVGKFLSPHLIRYNERISINGESISDEDMQGLIEELKPLIEEYSEKEKSRITLFELETMMALLYFYRMKVDFVVLETGLGGLYDCTNVITCPLVSIITSIGYDHMNLLGDTLPKIAFQKAGIVKPNSSTVIFEQTPDVDEVFAKECSKKENQLHIVREKIVSNYRYDSDLQYFDYDEMKDIAVNLKGMVQIKNASICIEAMKILRDDGYEVSDESIREGLKTVIHKARMEKLLSKPFIVYDGAHNTPAMENLQSMVDMYYSDFDRVYIVSILKSKDYRKMLKILASDKEGKFIFTSGNDAERYVDGNTLYECMKEYVDEDKISTMTLEDAIISTKGSDENTVNLVVGSFYVYGDVVRTIKNMI